MSYNYSTTRRRSTHARTAPRAVQQSLTMPTATPTAAEETFTPSAYQQAIFDFIRNVVALHGRVNARAGSGKTTTATKAAKYIPAGSKSLFVAFNKIAAEHLQKKLPHGMEARTCHSLGYRTIAKYVKDNKLTTSEYKYLDLIDDALYQLLPPDAKAETKRELKRLMSDLVHYCRVSLTDPLNVSDLEEMADHFGISLPNDEALYGAMRTQLSIILRKGQDMAMEQRVVDYDDMVWVPNVRGLLPEQYDIIFVDEAQDISKAQRKLIISALKPGGRTLWLGDRYQAINGFAGADADSFDAIQEELGAVDLKLTICYRCPPNILELARQYCPDIEAVPGKEDGEIFEIEEDDLARHLKPGAIVLCRTTAPLIAKCLHMLAVGKPAKMRGRDIGKSLMKTVEEVEGQEGYPGWDSFGIWLDMYRNKQEAKLQQRKHAESAIEALYDRVEAIRACYESPVLNARSAVELKTKIEGLFTDSNAIILFSTVHRAKGLEFDDVFILNPHMLPFERSGQKEWEKEQERNLTYVAYTRAMKRLIFVKAA